MDATLLDSGVIHATTVRDVMEALRAEADSEAFIGLSIEIGTVDSVSTVPFRGRRRALVTETAARPAGVKTGEVHDRNLAARRRHL